MIEEIEGLEKITSLTSLDLYGNQIAHIKGLESLSPSLTYLDLSFNSIHKIQNLEALVNLEELYLVNNKISEIPEKELDSLQRLKFLELGSNRIRVCASSFPSPSPRTPAQELSSKLKMGNNLQMGGKKRKFNTSKN